jgi:predicted alpha/beta-fold hydrolase
MGAIVLNNYVASYGATCALDAAIALSGGLDMRFQGDFFRAQRLWQPMLTETARDEFFIGKWGHKVKARLSRSDFVGLMRAKHITALDITAVAPYSGYDNVTHYYSEMSALGDIDHKRDGTLDQDYKGNKKVDSISIPLVVLQALDDPLVTWRATCANKGLMHPENLVKTGSGNLIILLTNAGGHVGWPLGLFFFQNKWKWMSDAVMGFAHAVHEVKQAQR